MFSKRLDKAMHDKGITVKMLADQLEVSEMTVYRWISGESDPTGKIVKLCKTLGVSADWILSLTRENRVAPLGDIYAELRYYRSLVYRLTAQVKAEEKRLLQYTLTSSEMEYERELSDPTFDRIMRDFSLGYYD